tara:strand:- start:8706 stop:9863 length:1158 start_codon:yes stop_codon:yes gene_type:complete
VRNRERIVVGIDAANIRHGGGITHLSQLLEHAKPKKSGISQVVIWSNQKTLEKLPDKSWLKKKKAKILDGNFLKRTFWQSFMLSRELSKEKCNILFVPGGSFTTSFKPIVSMHQNQLPFEFKEIARYGISLMAFKLIILRITQTFSFKNSNGIVFLSEYSQNSLLDSIDLKKSSLKIVHHGIEKRFFKKPREQIDISEYSPSNPYKLIYISSIDYYKHQWNVVEAVSRLREKGYPLRLDLYGNANPKALVQLENLIQKFDKDREYISYKKEINFNAIEKIYHNSDLSIFASSCETFGQIIIESMASGMPICCSKMSSMPEILKDGGVYFDPLDINEIAKALQEIIDSKDLRLSKSTKSYNYAKNFSWEKASEETFSFFKQVLEGG